MTRSSAAWPCQLFSKLREHGVLFNGPRRSFIASGDDLALCSSLVMCQNTHGEKHAKATCRRPSRRRLAHRSCCHGNAGKNGHRRPLPPSRQTPRPPTPRSFSAATLSSALRLSHSTIAASLRRRRKLRERRVFSALFSEIKLRTETQRSEKKKKKNLQSTIASIQIRVARSVRRKPAKPATQKQPD